MDIASPLVYVLNIGDLIGYVKYNIAKPIDKASVSQKIARKKKADRIEKGLRANREKARKT